MRHKPAYHPLHIPYKYPISQCDSETWMWVFAEFTKKLHFVDVHNHAFKRKSQLKISGVLLAPTLTHIPWNHKSTACVCTNTISNGWAHGWSHTVHTQLVNVSRCIPFECIRTIPTKYKPLGKDSDSKSPSFLQHPPQVCKVGHTTGRCVRFLSQQ